MSALPAKLCSKLLFVVTRRGGGQGAILLDHVLIVRVIYERAGMHALCIVVDPARERVYAAHPVVD